MTRRNVAQGLVVSMLAIAACISATLADDAPLPMRTGQPIVYATPIENAVILEFKLYDNKTWCRLYIAKEAWHELRANGGKLPRGADLGQLHCEQR